MGLRKFRCRTSRLTVRVRFTFGLPGWTFETSFNSCDDLEIALPRSIEATWEAEAEGPHNLVEISLFGTPNEVGATQDIPSRSSDRPVLIRGTAPNLVQVTSAPSSIEALQSRAGLWPARILWFLLPVLVGPAVGGLVRTQTSAFTTVVEVVLWLGWFVGAVALLAPSTVSLTAARILAPMVPIGVALSAVLTSYYEPDVVLAAIGSLAAAAVVFLPQTGDLMINGSSYGAERRLALRPPAGALLGPVQVAWLACAVGMLTGPLLMASELWALGLITTVAGAGMGLLGRPCASPTIEALGRVCACGLCHPRLLRLGRVALAETRNHRRAGPCACPTRGCGRPQRRRTGTSHSSVANRTNSDCGQEQALSRIDRGTQTDLYAKFAWAPAG